jgi:hypothetical protein
MAGNDGRSLFFLVRGNNNKISKLNNSISRYWLGHTRFFGVSLIWSNVESVWRFLGSSVNRFTCKLVVSVWISNTCLVISSREQLKRGLAFRCWKAGNFTVDIINWLEIFQFDINRCNAEFGCIWINIRLEKELTGDCWTRNTANFSQGITF